MANKEEWCQNSRRWIAFMIPAPPKTCPYATSQNGYICVSHACGYYEMRAPTKAYRDKAGILFSGDSNG